jgi:hypothetical protein
MNSVSFSSARVYAKTVCSRLRSQASRVPATVWVVLGLFLIAAVAAALHVALSEKDSNLHLKVQHSYRSAQISVWIDGDLAYSGKLSGYAKKKLGIFSESVQGSLSQVVPVSPGNHSIRVQITGEDGSTQQESISGDFAAKSERLLSVSARHGDVSLTWQGSNTTTSQPTNAAGWISRYANTLFLTIAGSIISALTGFAVREVPGYIKSRQETAPKAESASAGR